MRSIPSYSAPSFSATRSSTSKSSSPLFSKAPGGKPSSKNNNITNRGPVEGLFDGKAKVEILDTKEDDMFAASMYGGIRKKKKPKSRSSFQNKEGISGYDWDSLLQ